MKTSNSLAWKLGFVAVATVVLLGLLRLAGPGGDGADAGSERSGLGPGATGVTAGIGQVQTAGTNIKIGAAKAVRPVRRGNAHAPPVADESKSNPATYNEAKDALALVYDPEKSFADAAEEFGVPADLLKAIAQAESSGEHNSGYPNDQGGRGLMGLKQSAGQPMIERAAQLLGTDERTVIIDPVQNIRAAAALLRYYRGGDASWERAVASFSGLDAAGSAAYVEKVKRILQAGLQPTGEAGSNLRVAAGQAALIN